MKAPTTLIIMNGVGLAPDGADNAFSGAAKPNLEGWFADSPLCRLSASGPQVGLPEGQVGDAEAGLSNICAGRVVEQMLTRVNRALADGSFYANPALLGAMEHCREWGGALHLVGQISDGGVHSHIDHLDALLKMARGQGLERVWLHCILDGQDVLPRSGADWLRRVQALCQARGVGAVATVMGRRYAMDRDECWDLLQEAYSAMVLGRGEEEASPVDAVQRAYHLSIEDEFVPPVVCARQGRMRDNDSVIFFNFRPERMRELLRCLSDEDFQEIDRGGAFLDLELVSFGDCAMPNVTAAFPARELPNTLGAYLSQLGMTQLCITGSDKRTRVSSWLDGRIGELLQGAERCVIPAPTGSAQDPSAYEITTEAVRRIESGSYDLVVLDYAGCSAAGHSGDYDAARAAVSVLDECVGRVVRATAKMGGVALLTSSHGNVEQMRRDGVPWPGNTSNPVPLCVVGAKLHLRDGRLADIAPTILDLMGLEKPAEMDGKSLIL